MNLDVQGLELLSEFPVTKAVMAFAGCRSFRDTVSVKILAVTPYKRKDYKHVVYMFAYVKNASEMWEFVVLDEEEFTVYARYSLLQLPLRPQHWKEVRIISGEFSGFGRASIHLLNKDGNGGRSMPVE